MPKKTHSFIDIAVLDGVRELFLDADALVLLSNDLQEVLWANGQGVALLHLDDIEQASGAPANIPFLARRQIAALPGFPHIAGEQPAQLRLTQGSATAALLRSLALPSGGEAILLRVPAPAWLADERPARTISGIAEAGHFAALLDERGGVLAASGGFDGLEHR